MTMRPVFRLDQESKESLRATLKALLAKEGPHGCEDAKLIAEIRTALIDIALGVRDANGFPVVLKDEQDGLPW